MSDVTLTEDGHAKLDADADNVVRLQRAERSRKAKESIPGMSLAEDAEIIERRLTTVDLVVMGATIRQVAERHDVDYFTAREDYLEGMRLVNERTMEAVVAMRDEVTMRQKALIRTNMPLAMKGDEKAARIVQSADNMLTGLWGLRSAKIEITHRQEDSSLSDALDAYLNAVVETAATEK